MKNLLKLHREIYYCYDMCSAKKLVIFAAGHVYSVNPGDRFSAQGVISDNKFLIYN